MVPQVEVAEVAELEAVRDLWGACPAGEAEALGIRITEIGGGLAFAAGALAGSRELNRAVGLTAPDELDAAERFFHEAGLPFHVSLMPGTALEPELERRGYRRDYAWMKFTRAAGGPPPPPSTTDLRVAEVGVDRPRDFASTVVSGYGFTAEIAPWLAALPGRAGWCCLVAYDGERPVSAGALFVHQDVGWLGFAATLSDARGRGAQSALLARRIERAFDLGCRTLVTETGERAAGRPSGSYRNILRAGFEEAYLRPNFRSP